MKNVLIACEESQAIANEFRKIGFNAFSADIQKCSGGHPEYHINQDVLPLLNGNCKFKTQDGKTHSIKGHWDLIIAHPPCTYLSNAGNGWYKPQSYTGLYKKDPKLARLKVLERMANRQEAYKFFMKFTKAKCDHVVIENPLGYMNGQYRPADQTIQPYQFGDKFSKRTCLWIKGLPKLKSTKLVDKGEFITLKNGKRISKWFADAYSLPTAERRKVRSKTFKGIAHAMVDQWKDLI